MNEQTQKPDWRAEARNWYVVVTNPNNEKKAVGELRRAGFRVFLPSRAIQQRNRKTGERSVRHTPLLTGYLFLKFPPERLDKFGVPHFRSVRLCQGVKAFVTVADARGEFRPFSVEDTKVAEFLRRQRRREFGSPSTEEPMDRARRMYPAGRSMRVANGPFDTFIATIERVLESGAVEAVVEIFGRSTKIQFMEPDEFLKPIASEREAA